MVATASAAERERPVDLIHASWTEEVLAVIDRLEAGACL